MPNSTYYSSTNDGRAAWWQNISDNGGPVLLGLGFTQAEINPILADADWAVYSYLTVRTAYDAFMKAVTAYEDEILNGDIGTALPAAPAVPVFPAAPAAGITRGIESRRALWVQAAKARTSYTSAAGAMLGIESSATPFDPTTYQAELTNLVSTSAQTLSGKFRKAGGNLDSINLYGRKVGSTAQVLIGKFTATPFTAQVPLSGSAPEEWQFEARAVKRDVEFGLPSAASSVLIRA